MKSSLKSSLKRGADRMLEGTMWLLCRAITITPYWFQYYVLQEIIYFVLRYIVGYRRRLIIGQLSSAFPDKSGREVEDICNKYYRSLAEMIVNTLTLAGLTDEQRAKRVEFDTPEDMDRVMSGRNIVVLTSHFGFWEYASFAYLRFAKHHLLVAYHPLKNSAWNNFYYRIRKMKRVEPVSSKMYMRAFVNHRHGIDGNNLILGLIADQNCPPTKDCKWHRFLNHDTLFYDGGEQLAMKFGMPVYYLAMEPIKRGRYRCRFVQIYDGEESVPSGEITSRYAQMLEQSIVAQPEYWMWSHNRWKFARWEGSTLYVPQQRIVE